MTFFLAFGLNMFPWMWHLVQQINCSLPLLGLNDGCGVVVLARLSRSLTCELDRGFDSLWGFETADDVGDLLTHFSPAFVHVSRLVVDAMAPFSASRRAKTEKQLLMKGC